MFARLNTRLGLSGKQVTIKRKKTTGNETCEECVGRQERRLYVEDNGFDNNG
jgi:hypothetical protein